MNDFKLLSGVDIVKNSRVEDMYRSHGERFLEKVFTQDERLHIQKKQYRIETISGLFAGKEAVSKALGRGIGRISFQDINIIHDNFGKPFVELSEAIRKEYSIGDLDISISHEKDYTIAFVIGSKIV